MLPSRWPPMGPEVERGELRATVYTDGSSYKNGDERARCGSGAWVAEADETRAWKITGQGIKDNNAAEIMAISLAVRQIRSDRLEILTDSKLAIKAVREAAQEEGRGYVNSHYRDEKRHLLESLRGHGGSIGITWVKGHSEDHGNDMADAAAKRADLNPDEIVRVRREESFPFRISEAKLKTITQYLDEISSTRMMDNPDRRRGVTALRSTAEEWDIVPTLKIIQKGIWESSDSPLETDFLWRWFWDLLWEPEVCPWCYDEYSLLHVIKECGPSDWARWWESSHLDSKYKRKDWNVLPVLPLLSEARGRDKEKDKLIRKEMTLIAKAVYEEVQSTLETGTRKVNVMRTKVQRRLYALSVAEGARAKAKEKKQ